MIKDLLRNKQEYEHLVKSWTGYQLCHGNVVNELEEPEHYPCVVLFEIKYYDNGADYLTGEYVYPEDFED